MQKVYTKIESIVGNVVTVRAKDVRLGDLALVGDSYATVIKLNKDVVSLQVFAGAQGVGTSDPVRFLGRPMMASFSDHLLGRVFDGAGVPRDHGPALTENSVNLKKRRISFVLWFFISVILLFRQEKYKPRARQMQRKNSKILIN